MERSLPEVVTPPPHDLGTPHGLVAINTTQLMFSIVYFISFYDHQTIVIYFYSKLMKFFLSRFSFDTVLNFSKCHNNINLLTEILKYKCIF